MLSVLPSRAVLPLLPAGKAELARPCILTFSCGCTEQKASWILQVERNSCHCFYSSHPRVPFSLTWTSVLSLPLGRTSLWDMTPTIDNRVLGQVLTSLWDTDTSHIRAEKDRKSMLLHYIFLPRNAKFRCIAQGESSK